VDDLHRGGAGGIRELVELIGEHPDEFQYDWRTRFGMPIAAVFDGRMSWREAASLTRTLIGDLTSRVGAAVRDWDYPLSHEARVAMDTYDVLAIANTAKKDRHKLKPYPRPWPQEGDAVRSQAPTVSQDTIREALKARGH
jgi:hypothetical protein